MRGNPVCRICDEVVRLAITAFNGAQCLAVTSTFQHALTLEQFKETRPHSD